jgi:hypothetical protein
MIMNAVRMLMVVEVKRATTIRMIMVKKLILISFHSFELMMKFSFKGCKIDEDYRYVLPKFIPTSFHWIVTLLTLDGTYKVSIAMEKKEMHPKFPSPPRLKNYFFAKPKELPKFNCNFSLPFKIPPF